MDVDDGIGAEPSARGATRGRRDEQRAAALSSQATHEARIGEGNEDRDEDRGRK